MSDAAAEERRQKAAARQAKLLAKSKERLDKITGAAKGEGRIVNDTTGGIPPRPPASAATSNPAPPTSLAELADVNDDPAEIDLGAHANPLSLLAGTGPDSENPFAGFGGGAGGGPPGEDPFSQMMAQMMAGMGGGAPGAGPAGVQTNPFMGGSGGQSPTSAFAPAPKTLLERFFPLVHIASMVALAVYVICVYEPAKRAATSYGWSEGHGGGIDWSAWSALLSRRPTELGLGTSSLHSLASVPLLWMFVSVELILQTTRLFLLRNRPAAPSMLNSVLPLVSQFSPQLGLAIQTGVRYLDLFSTCLNDLAVLVFCIGLAALVGRWKAGPPTGLVEIVADKVNEALDRAAGDL